jgi:drug/metabolite transporter (DMT)-like permease
VRATDNRAEGAGDRIGIGLALLAVYIVWGSTYLAMRIGLAGGLPPFGMAGVRFVLAGGGLMLALRLRGVPAPTRAEWGGATIVGGLLLGLGNGGVMFAEYKGVTSGLAALGVATVPLWTALMAGVWGQWPYKREWLGLGVGFLGIVCLNLDGGLRASPTGAVALVVSALAWAFGSTWSRRLPLPPGAMAAGAQMLCGGVLLLGASLVRGEHLTMLPPLRADLAFVYLVFAAVVGYSAYSYLLARVRPTLATSYAYVNPIIAVGLGALLVGERVGPSALAALVLILVGVGLAAFAKAPGTVIEAEKP